MRRALSLIGLGLFVASGAAHAVYTETEILTGWSPKAGGGFVRNMYNPAMQSTSRALAIVPGGVRALTTATLAGPAGPLTVVASGVMSRAAIGAAVGRCLMLANPLCAAGTAAYIAYDYFRVSAAGGELVFDPGIPPEMETRYLCTQGLAAPKYGGSPGSACSAFAVEQKRLAELPTAGHSGQQPWYTYTINVGACGPTQCVGTLEATQHYYFADVLRTSTSTFDQTWNHAIDGQQPICPAYSVGGVVHEKGSSIGPDGKCRTGYGAVPITAQEAGQKFDQFPPSDAALPGIADAGIKGGQGVEATAGATTGPASQTGAPVTGIKTGPDGTVTSETVTSEYHFDYADGDSITYNKTETTQTCVGTEACSTTEITTPPTEDTQDPEDPCVKNPESIGCSEFGTPENPELPKDSIPISVTSQSGWGADNAACPAPRSVSVLGVPVLIDNSLICDFMGGIRFAVLGAFGIMSALVFVGGLKN